MPLRNYYSLTHPARRNSQQQDIIPWQKPILLSHKRPTFTENALAPDYLEAYVAPLGPLTATMIVSVFGPCHNFIPMTEKLRLCLHRSCDNCNSIVHSQFHCRLVIHRGGVFIDAAVNNSHLCLRRLTLYFFLFLYVRVLTCRVLRTALYVRFQCCRRGVVTLVLLVT